jgi:hypothetical protein
MYKKSLYIYSRNSVTNTRSLTAQVILGGGQIIQRLAKHTSRLESGSHNTSKARWKVTLNLYRPQGSSKAHIFLPWPHDFVLYIHLASHEKWRSKMSIGTTDILRKVIQNPCHHIVSHESAGRTLDQIQILRPAEGGMFFKVLVQHWSCYLLWAHQLPHLAPLAAPPS